MIAGWRHASVHRLAEGPSGRSPCAGRRLRQLQHADQRELCRPRVGYAPLREEWWLQCGRRCSVGALARHLVGMCHVCDTFDVKRDGGRTDRFRYSLRRTRGTLTVCGSFCSAARIWSSSSRARRPSRSRSRRDTLPSLRSFRTRSRRKRPSNCAVTHSCERIALLHVLLNSSRCRCFCLSLVHIDALCKTTKLWHATGAIVLAKCHFRDRLNKMISSFSLPLVFYAYWSCRCRAIPSRSPDPFSRPGFWRSGNRRFSGWVV